MAWIDKRRTDFPAEEKKKKEEQAQAQQQAQQEWAQPRSTNASSGAVSSPGTKASSRKTTTNGKKTTSGSSRTTSSGGSSGGSSGNSKPSYNKVSWTATPSAPSGRSGGTAVAGSVMNNVLPVRSLAGRSGFGAYSPAVWNAAAQAAQTQQGTQWTGSLAGRSGFGADSAPAWNAAAQSAAPRQTAVPGSGNAGGSGGFGAAGPSGNTAARNNENAAKRVIYGKIADNIKTAADLLSWNINESSGKKVAPTGADSKIITGQIQYAGDRDSNLRRAYERQIELAETAAKSPIWNGVMYKTIAPSAATMYSLPDVQQRIAERQQQVQANRAAMAQKYDLDLDKFDDKAFNEWSKKYGYGRTYDNMVDPATGVPMYDILEMPGKNAALKEDAKSLYLLAIDNMARSGRHGAFETAGASFMDGVSSGFGTDVGDGLMSELYRSNGSLLAEPPLSGKEALAIAQSEYPVASFLGQTSGNVASSLLLGEVAGAAKLVPGFVKLAKPVQDIVISAVAMGAQRGISTAGHLDSKADPGDALKRIAVSTAFGALGGAVGGAASAGTNSLIEKVLFNSGLRNSFAAQTARGILSSGAFAAGDSLGSSGQYLFLSKEERPTARDIGMNILTAMAFGAVQTGTSMFIKTRADRARLDHFTQRMQADYQGLVDRANSSYAQSGDFDAAFREHAANVGEYARAIDLYLDGTGYYGTIAGELVDLPPGAEFIGQQKQIDSIRAGLRDVMTRTAEFTGMSPRRAGIGAGTTLSAANGGSSPEGRAYGAGGIDLSRARADYDVTKGIAERGGFTVRNAPTLSHPADGGALEGFANTRTGEISIAGNARSKGETAAHEAGHIIERHAPESYGRLSDMALGAAAWTNENAVNRRFEQKQSDGYGRDELRSEVTNDILGAIAGDAAAIRRLTSDRTGRTGALISTFENLKARAKDALGGRVRTANGLELSYTQLNELTDNLRAGLDAARGRYVPDKNVGESEAGEIRHLFSPRGDQEQKRAAIEMERQGAAPEEIWRATGWGRGLDGKWRTEIDDSGSEFNSLGNAMLDKEDFAVRRQELYNKWFDGSITDEELGELNDLDDRYSEVSKQRAKMPKTVRDYLDHEELYKRHPELGDMSMSIEPVEEGTWGFYSPNSKSIALSDTRLHEPTYHGRATTLHELQHAIQDRSAFAGGSSPEEFGGDETKYYNTAGEIEARDVERRRRLTPEQRRNTFPESMKPNENAEIKNNSGSMPAGAYSKTGYLTSEAINRIPQTDPIVNTQDDIKSSRRGISNAEHTPEMRRIMDQYENSVDPDFVRFVLKVKDDPNDNRSNFVISTVSDRAAADIKRLTGIDVTGFKSAIKSNSIRHIVKGHGENGDTDTSMSDIKDIARMPYVIDNYDDVELLPNVSAEYRDKDQKPAPMVRFRKRIDGTYYVIEAVPDTRRGQLPVVSAYIQKAAPQTENVINPSPETSETASANAAINNSVSQPDGIVNTQDDIKFSRKTPAGAKAYFKRQYWDSLHPTDRMYLADFNRDIDAIFDLYRSAEAEGFDPRDNAELREAAHDLAEHIVSNTYTAAGDADTRDAIRREIRGVHIYVSPRGRTSGELGADGYGSFRKEAFGADVYLTPDRDLGISADTYYGELQGQYGKDYFPDYNTPEEMIRHIVEFMKEKPVGERSYRDSDTEGIAEGILSDVERCLYPEPEELSAAGEAVRSYVSGARPRDRAELYQRVDAAYKTVETAVRRGYRPAALTAAADAIRPIAEAIDRENADSIAAQIFGELGNLAAASVPEAETGSDTKERLSKLFINSMHKEHYGEEFRRAADARKDDFKYAPHNNEDDYNAAWNDVEGRSPAEALNDLYALGDKEWGAEETTKALALVEHFNKVGDYNRAIDVYYLARAHATKQGQAIQAWSIIDRLSPEGQYIFLQRENERQVEEQLKRRTKEEQDVIRREIEEAREKDAKEARERNRRRAEQDEAAEVEPPTPPTEPGAYKEEPVPPRGRGKRDSGSFIERMRARIAAGSTPPAESSGKKQPRRRSIEDGKRTRRTKPAAVTDSNRAAVKSGIDRLRTLLRVPANERIDPDIHYSRKSISDKISSEVKDRILRLIEDGSTEKALAAIDGLRLDEYGYEGLSQPDRDFLSQVTQSMEYGYYGGEDSISKDRRAEIYTLLRSGNYAAAEDMIDGYYNSVLSKSDLEYLSAVMDEYEDSRSLFDEALTSEEAKPLGRAIYSPSTEELLSKPDAVATTITAPYKGDENGHVENIGEEFKKAREYLNDRGVLGAQLVNGDKEYSEKYGPLTGQIVADTLKKGRSYKTPYMARQLQIMYHLDEVFKNGKVIKVAEGSAEGDKASKIYTILSPVVFAEESNREQKEKEEKKKVKAAVVKLNVKEFHNPNAKNKIHENKVLDIQDIDLVEVLDEDPNKKEPETSKALPPAMDGSGHSVSGSYTMSIAQMLEFVKNFDVKYLPEDYPSLPLPSLPLCNQNEI